MHGSGRHHRHIGIVHVVFLDVLKHLAKHAQRSVGLIVVGLTQNVPKTHVKEDHNGKRDNRYFGETAHSVAPSAKIDSKYNITAASSGRGVSRRVSCAEAALK